MRAGDGPALLLCAIPKCAVHHRWKNIWQKYRWRLRGAIIKSYRWISFLCSPWLHRGSIALGSRQNKTAASCHQRHNEKVTAFTAVSNTSRLMPKIFAKYLHSKYQARIKSGRWETGDRTHGARAQNYKARNRADNLEIYTPIRRTIRFIGGAMQIMQWARRDSGM